MGRHRTRAALAAAVLAAAPAARAAPYAFVPGYADGSLTAVDLATGAAVRTVPAEVGLPYGVSVAPDGARVFVSGLGGGVATFDAAALLDATPGAPAGHLGTVASPTLHSLAVSPDGATVWAAGRDSGTLWAIDVASGTSSPVGGMGNPVGVAVSPDGRWVGVGNFGGTFALVDASTRRVASIGLGASAWGVAFTPDARRAVVTIWGATPSGSLAVIDVPSLAIRWVSGTTALSGVAVAPDGRRAWATANASSLLYEVDLAASPPALGRTVDLSAAPGLCVTSEGGGVSVTPDGSTVLVACPGGDRIVTVDAEAAAVTGSVPVGDMPRSLGVMTAPGAIRAGALVHLPLDADGRDRAEQGRALAPAAGASFVAGRLGGALACGPAGCGTLPSAPRLDAPGPLTVAAWVKPAAAGPATLLSKGAPAAPAWALEVAADGAVRAVLPAGTVRSPGGLASPGRWTHVALAWDGLPGAGRIVLHVNGTPVARGDASAAASAGGGDLALGSGAAGPLAGALDDVRVVSSALTPAEVAALAAARELFVPSYGATRITAHLTTEDGAAPPARELSGPATLQVGPNGVAVDAGSLFLADHNGHSLRAWDAFADGEVAPLRSVSGGASGLLLPSQVAVRGREVFLSQYGGALSVFDRDAAGGVAPLRTVGSLSNTYALALHAGELYVARHPDSGDANTVRVYAASAGPGDLPLRTLGGPSTGISFASALAVARGELLVASYFDGSVRVFDRRATGDAAPLRVIAGPATRLVNPIGLAVVDDELWVSSRGGNEVLAFGLRDQGDVAPRRVIGGPLARLSQPMALAAAAGPGPVVNGGFEADAPGTGALTGLGTAWYTDLDGVRGQSPLGTHELGPSAARALEGSQSLRSFLGNQGLGNNDPNRRNLTQEVVASCVDLSRGPLVLWRSAVAHTTTHRYAYRLTVVLEDGAREEEVMLHCRSLAIAGGCPGDLVDTHDATADGTGGTFFRHVVVPPPALDPSCVTVTIRHAQDAMDPVYNESEVFIDAVAATVDGAAPVVDLALPLASASAEVPVTLVASDPSGVAGYCGSETADPSGCAFTSDPPATHVFSGLVEGVPAIRTLFAFARDRYGNVSPAASATVTITLPDVTAPTVTAFDLPAAATSATVPIAALAATDNGDVAAWCVQESAEPAACAWLSSPPASHTFQGLRTAVPEVRTLRAFARDAAGNVSAAAQGAVTITLPDVTPPEVTFRLPAEAASATVAVETFFATDDVVIDGFCLQESADPAACAWLSSPPASHTFAGLPAAVPSLRTLRAFARDAAGNVSAAATASVTITLPDVTAPVVSAFSMPDVAEAATVPVGVLAATDDVAVTGWCLHESADAAGCTWLSSPPASHTFAGLQATVPSLRTLHAFARDAAGNASEPVASRITITLPDVTAPEVTAFAPPSTVVVPRVTVAALAAADDVAVAEVCVVEGTAPAGCAWVAAPPVTLDLGGLGPRTVSAFARDAAGNVSAAATVTVTVAPLPGDVDLDGTVARADALAVWDAVLGRRTLSADERARGDVAPLGAGGAASGDGVLDALDAIAIVRLSLDAR
jgi:DNA-binding beta-propeller fold protein YncE